jgi:hypothetical protein
MIHPVILSDLKGHVTNGLGCFATITSAVSADVSDSWTRLGLTFLSVLVGLLTVIHLALQIRVLALAVLKEKVLKQK